MFSIEMDQLTEGNLFSIEKVVAQGKMQNLAILVNFGKIIFIVFNGTIANREIFEKIFYSKRNDIFIWCCKIFGEGVYRGLHCFQSYFENRSDNERYCIVKIKDNLAQ